MQFILPFTIEYAKKLKKGIHCKSETRFGAKINLPNKVIEYSYDSVQKIFEPISNTSDIKYFLKPVGVSESPFKVGRKLLDEDMYFSKRFPRAVDKESILICYGVGVHKLLGYYKVLSDHALLDQDPHDERWPYYVKSKCLSVEYSKNWWSYNLMLSDLRDEFVMLHPNKPVTYKGSQSLGTLNWGADKVRLSTEFAEFLIEKIDNCMK